jgi:hypothetical protein
MVKLHAKICYADATFLIGLDASSIRGRYTLLTR